MKSFEDQVYAVLKKIKNDTKSDESGSELEKTNKNLQSMVNHYKQIIYDTVWIGFLLNSPLIDFHL